MSKIVLNSIANPNDVNSIVSVTNANNTVIQQAFDNTLSRDGTSPNQMNSNLDMNSFRIINLPQPLTPNQPLRLADLNSFIGGGTISTIPAGGTTGQVLQKNSNVDYDITWNSAVGTVTSVGLTMPADFSVTGSPINSSGTFAVSLVNTPTGTGGFVRATGPTLVTPVLGVATATSINKVSFTAPATGATLTIADGKTLTTNNSLTFTGTDGTSFAFPGTSDTVVGIAASQTLTNKTLTTPVIGNGGLTMTGVSSGTQVLRGPSAASGTITVPAGTYSVVGDTLTQTLFSKSISGGGLTFLGSSSGSTIVAASATASGTLTLPAATDTLAGIAATQTFTNKTISGATNTLTNLPAANISGNMQVTNFNGGTGASGSTFLRGDMTWATPSGGGSVTSVTGNGVTITGTGTIPSGYGLVNHGLSISASAGALTINLTDAAGATPSATSPVYGQFYSPNTGNGTWSALTVSSALSLVLPSSSTLGVSSSSAFRLWIVLFNDAGTARLGAINCRSGVSGAAPTIYTLIESQVASSTAVSGSATAGGTFYTGTAVTSKSFLIVGYLEWNSSGITAGTWTTTNQTYIRSFGPGVRKPGEPVGNLQSIFMGAGSSGATSMADVTGATLTMTPSSPANIFKVFCTASCVVSAGGASTNSTYTGQLLRGATVLSNFAMGVVSGGGTNQQSQGAAAWHAIDFPNTSSNSTFKLQHSATGGSATAQTYNVCMSVEEIMT